MSKSKKFAVEKKLARYWSYRCAFKRNQLPSILEIIEGAVPFGISYCNGDYDPYLVRKLISCYLPLIKVATPLSRKLYYRGNYVRKIIKRSSVCV